MNQQRYIVLIFALAGVLMGLFLHQASQSVLAQLSVPDDSWFGGVASTSTLVALVGGVVTFFGLLRYPAGVKFTGEVVTEMSKVTWPTRDEAVRAATTVVGTAVVLALLLGFFDFFWKSVADTFLYS